MPKNFSPTLNSFFYYQGNFLCFLVLVLFCCFLPGVNADWQYQLVDLHRRFTEFYPRAIAVEHTTNNPHIAYGGDKVYHAYF
ncbi:MAG: hypothetical protein N2246_05130, partial [Candidatus Sumerlaeia bacterium]|nr:hypothetical protein [Candidatus Sumerlaeia bacterium]